MAGEPGSPVDSLPDPNLVSPQLTVRAIGTGMLLGALLTPCNIYSGLKIGWSFNMSVAAALLSYALWKTLEQATGAQPWGLLENNINQTAASASASIISSGLVAPIPALAILTGQQLPWGLLAVWVLSVSLIGVVVGVGLRQQMILREALPFPAGVATAETVREIYGKGAEALARVHVLLTAGVVAGVVKLVSELLVQIPRLGPPLSVPSKGALKAAGVPSVSLHNLGFVLDPSLLMLGFGAIIGIHAGASLLLGAVVAWGVIGPWGLTAGWVEPGPAGPDRFWFGSMVKWLLWPGVTMMVTASLASVAFSLPSMVLGKSNPRGTADQTAAPFSDEVPRRWFLLGLLGALVFAVITQASFFNISILVAIFAVLLTFVLAIVAARVSGETGITPIGALGKVTQLTFGVLVPGQTAANLMTANVTGGAAGQCADLLHDLKAGLILGASPRLQAIAQVFGVLTGSLVGSAVYLVLIPDPKGMLLTKEWPAPAVATWKAVAEVLQQGFGALPPNTVTAMVIAALVGLGLVILEKTLPTRAVKWVPSAPAMGLAFVVPAWNSLSLFLGAFAGFVLFRVARTWTDRFLLAGASGLVAGEGLAGVAAILGKLLFSDGEG